MAEIFGAVASGAGLASLAIQLLESSQRLKAFYDASKGAPHAIADLSFDLRTMSLSLRQLESYRRSDVLGDELLERCITTCKRMIGKIESAVSKMERQLQRSRNVGRMYAAFKEPETRRLLEEMEHAKSSMLFAYMSYCQCCNTRNASARVAMTNAQNALLATHQKHLQVLDSTMQAGHAAILSRIDSLDTSTTGLSQPAISTPMHDRTQDRQKHPNRRPTLKYRLTLPRWFTDTIWELAAYSCESGCIFQLRPVNVREEGAFVFEVVRSGNTEAVRALLASGEISSSDYECDPYRQRHQSLVMIAAAAGHAELCDFLLGEFTCYRSDADMRKALEAYLQERQYREPSANTDQVTETFYKLFIGKHGLQIDLQDLLRRYDMSNGIRLNDPEVECNTLLTKTALQEVLATQNVPFRAWSFAERFHVVVNSCCWPAETLVELMRPATLTELATYRDTHGRTALHWAAEHFGYWDDQSYSNKCRKIRDSYARVSMELISIGADPHALDSTHETPLSCMLQNRYFSHGRIWPCNVARLIRHWGCAINSVCDLRSYAERESSLQAQRGYSFRGFDLEGFSEIRSYSLFVSKATVLTINVVGSLQSVLWKFCPPPGAWERTAYGIDLVSWRPTAYFEGETHYLWQKAGCVGRSLEASLSEEVDRSSLKTSFSNARCEWISGVQDDHGFVATQWRGRTTRRTRLDTRQRTASLPPPQFLVDDTSNPFEDLDINGAWISRAHKCSFDMAWKCSWDGPRGQLDTRRRCMQGRCDDWEPVLLGTGFWEAKLLRDTNNLGIARRFIDRFHPEWRSVLEKNHREAQRRTELGLSLLSSY